MAPPTLRAQKTGAVSNLVEFPKISKSAISFISLVRPSFECSLIV